MEKRKNPPLCYRCAAQPAVACVRAKIGCKDAVCVSCVTPNDVMLPLYWPGLSPPLPFDKYGG